MMNYPVVSRVAALAMIGSLLSQTAAAQTPGAGTVAGTGRATVERPPMLLRMSVVLTGKAKTLDEALAKLKDRSGAARLQLEKFEAASDSIKLTPPTFATAVSAQQAQMEQMLRRQHLSSGGRAAREIKIPKSMVVSSTLTAEWPLTSEGDEQLITTVNQLQETIKAADLAGLNEPEALSAEEQELAEEMEQMMSEYGYGGDGDEAKPGEPTFVYVARIAPAERDQALAEAFAKAKSQAILLADAAGAKLGKLQRLTGSTQSGATAGLGGEEYEYWMARMPQSVSALTPNRDDESISSQLGPIRFQFLVEAEFQLP